MSKGSYGHTHSIHQDEATDTFAVAVEFHFWEEKHVPASGFVEPETSADGRSRPMDVCWCYAMAPKASAVVVIVLALPGPSLQTALVGPFFPFFHEPVV